ncbi:protein-disulfide reductase DsbD family protein [Allopontixanthobacter sediminis]|uniref:Thiol:disulfide interchange protein n=1 Tax=Allopontixanthobacter sediminis TaxID=1689985 RepID=A0A845AZ15_9SPHN|nr:protein-disulfide reductase DsbD [Allopontixanthobacter sediminis]MXP43114.1 thiol:disulfide interchange protein [Allopontixanthobacter sediminis]
MSAFRPLNFVLLLAFLLAALAAAPAPASAQAADNNIEAKLIAEGPVAAGKRAMLAIRFTPEPGWHGYWKNPGDAGYGMTLDWQLPAGWQAGEPQYPVPHQLLISGLMNHVYKGPYTVLIPVTAAQDVPDGGRVPISVTAQWLACTDVICVPERAVLQATVPTSGQIDPRFTEWRAAIPPQIDRAAAFMVTDELLRVAIPLPAAQALPDPHIYLENTGLIAYGADQRFSRTGDLLIGEIPLALYGEAPEDIKGILAFEDGQGVGFEAAAGPVPAGGVPLAGTASETPPLAVLLLGAFVGGLMLNIMPCVFPILSLKALTLARAGTGQREARAEGLAYTAGVILASTALGGLLLALRAAGEQVGWAFQLQEPGVVVALAVLAAAITANLAGLFELPSISITRRGEPASAFATGLLAAAVATPCTGPFMAAALGAALLLPPVQALVLFAVLGLGLALPFLLIGMVPALRRLLPQPGAWMEAFRKLMAIPMGLTALALMWLVWRIGGDVFAVMTLALAAALIGAFALLGRQDRTLRYAGFAAIAVGALLLAGMPGTFERSSARAETSILDPVDFTAANLAEARSTGRPVFLWFTADWCVTCKVNESVAIERDATREAFEAAGVIAVKGDWTERDPEITRFLTAQGAAGIPLYIWYGPDGQQQQLGQVLAPDSLVDLANGT